MEKKWEKHRIGKIYGNAIFVEVPPGLSGKEHIELINKCNLFLEEAVRNEKFIETLREFLTPLSA